MIALAAMGGIALVVALAGASQKINTALAQGDPHPENNA